jgi:hypothetical protein
MTATEQLANLRQSLLEAYVARDAADEKIKAIRNVLAGVPIGQALAAEPETPVTSPSDA